MVPNHTRTPRFTSNDYRPVNSVADKDWSKFIFEKYFSTVLRTVSSDLYAFFHPALTGYGRDNLVVEGHRSVIGMDVGLADINWNELLANCTDSSLDETVLKQQYDAVSAYYNGRLDEEYLTHARNQTLQELSWSPGLDMMTRAVEGCFYLGRVAQLGIPEIEDYDTFIKKYYLLPAPLGSPSQRVVDISNFAGLQLQQLAYHQHIRREIESGYQFSTTMRESELIVIPLSILRSGDSQNATFPMEFRGGVWIFAFVENMGDTELSRYEGLVNELVRDLRIVLNHYYNRQSARGIAEAARFAVSHSLTHQLPNDFGRMAHVLGQIEKLASAPQLDTAELLQRVTEFDPFLVQGMVLTAGLKKRLVEHPAELAARFRAKLTPSIIGEVIRRVVVPTALERVLQEFGTKGVTIPPRDRFEQLGRELEQAITYNIQGSAPPGNGLFPLFVMVARNCVQHALIKWIADGGLGREPPPAILVTARMDDTIPCLSISNPGLPPAAGALPRQAGTERDLHVFYGLTNGWEVKEESPGLFTTFDDATGLWLTRICRMPSITGRG